MANAEEDYQEQQAADWARQQEMVNADRLRQEKMAAKDKARQAEAAKAEPGKEEPKSLRQQLAAARQKYSVENLKNKAKAKVEEKVAAPIASATGRGLRWAWWSLISSWGLSLIWINIHVFLRMVLGEKLFCKLGHEWVPKQVESATGEAGETVGKAAGIVEVMILLLLDIIALVIILGALAIIALIVDFLNKPLWDMVVTIWNLDMTTIIDLYNLFKDFVFS